MDFLQITLLILGIIGVILLIMFFVMFLKGTENRLKKIEEKVFKDDTIKKRKNHNKDD